MGKDEEKEEYLLPPISIKREFVRFAVMLGTILSTVGPAIWYFTDNHWLHPDPFEKHVEQSERRQEAFERYKIEQTRSLYWMRMQIMDEQLNSLRERKHVYPEKWDGLNEARLLKMEKDYSNLYAMYRDDQKIAAGKAQ
jgi:hypothetical protein